MPPRPPPPPAVLTALCSIAAVAALWVTVATDQVARGLVGAALGVPFRGLEISPARHYLVVARQGDVSSLGSGAFALVVLAGPALAIGVAFAVYSLVRAIHAPGWLRGFALGWVVASLMWLPAALVAAALPHGTGPVHELYSRLGDPMSGRWTALVLGVFAVALAAGTISRCAVAIGRSWLRADGREFRRRLVRVTAGWPAAIVLVLLAFGVGWAMSPWALIMPLAALVALHFQTL